MEKGTLVQTKGKGASGSFKLPAKPKAPKKPAGEKKPKVKKAKAPGTPKVKKLAAKKSKSPTKQWKKLKYVVRYENI